MKTARFCVFVLVFAFMMFTALLPAPAEEGEGASLSEQSAYQLSEESAPRPRGFAMSYGFKPLVAPDGAKASDYVKGPAPPVSYVAGGDSYTVAENGYTFRDYVFAGWRCGEKLYQPGEVIYNVRSDMQFVAEWVRPERPAMKVLGIISYSVGGETETVSAECGAAAKLKGGVWRDCEGRVFEGGSRFLLSATRADFEAADKPSDAVSVRYEGVSDGAQCPFWIERGGVFTVDGCFAEREGFAFTGWKSGDRLYLEGDSCEAAENTVFTAVWRELEKPKPDFCRVSVSAGEGGRVSPVGQSSVLRGQDFTFSAVPNEGYALQSVVCGGNELGTGGSYTLTVKYDVDISVRFVKTEVSPESKPDAASEAESAAHDVSDVLDVSDEPHESGKSTAHRVGATAAVAAVCAFAVVLAAWYTGRARKK